MGGSDRIGSSKRAAGDGLPLARYLREVSRKVLHRESRRFALRRSARRRCGAIALPEAGGQAVTLSPERDRKLGGAGVRAIDRPTRRRRRPLRRRPCWPNPFDITALGP